MQRDKALLEVRGELQLMRSWRLLRTVCESAFVSMRADQREDPLRTGLPHLVDRFDSVGPVAGILSAQEAFPQVAWLVLACDLPLVDLATLQVLVAARDPAYDATAFRSRFDALPEPLCAVWEPSSHALLENRYHEGRWCPRKALLQLRAQLLASPGDALDNVNTPEEFRDLRSQLESRA
jgi:molybdenum cofactor guanylyltransferase